MADRRDAASALPELERLLGLELRWALWAA
jgi:hypothetical protein